MSRGPEETVTAETAAEPAPRRGVGSLIKELLIVVVGAVIISSLIRLFLGQMFVIPSGSMEHTLEIGDRVAVQKVTHFHRGQIVVFADPGGWLGADEQAQPRGPVGKALEFVGVLPDTSTNHLIKRVIGMPGDHVVCCDSRGRITVNGYPLNETSYLYRDGDDQVRPSDTRFDVVVPAGRIWVMGDHRDDSADSRCHLNDVSLDGIRGSNAFVPETDVVGPAFAIVFPFSRATILHTPATFDGVPAPASPAPAEPKINTPNAGC
ncbi:signal peptidase I [Friedmanniella endophytica]|uniref:Signal peptidase I n=1 Tax=Microlunatus kandeliicorticis TaxID=1759536 RepID=A0A7W3P734_9ACTN|nr:signal peptidase I [Microlunatus kandeliicorticis]MBA8795691.1 signal peptidase I [Microlunatus kandeliicorticis]